MGGCLEFHLISASAHMDIFVCTYIPMHEIVNILKIPQIS